MTLWSTSFVPERSMITLAEIKVLPEFDPDGTWGGPLSETTTALGGQSFTGWTTPNGAQPDTIGRAWLEPQYYMANGIPNPIRAPGVFRANPAKGQPNEPTYWQSQVPRSHHVGGVNASRCDGSVKYYSDSVDPYTWNALSSAAGGEVVNEVQQPVAPRLGASPHDAVVMRVDRGSCAVRY
jgi:hypothetical protein